MKSFFALVLLASFLPASQSTPLRALFAAGYDQSPAPSNYDHPPPVPSNYDQPAGGRGDNNKDGGKYDGPKDEGPDNGSYDHQPNNGDYGKPNNGDYEKPNKDDYGKPNNGDYGKPNNGDYGKPDQGQPQSCPDPFPKDGKYKLEHIDIHKLFSFCTGGCIKKDNKVYRTALKSVVSKELRDSREWYNLWDVHKSGGNRIKLTVGDVGSLRAEKGKYGEDVAVFVDKKGADQLWTVTVHPNKDCAITLHNEAGQYIKRGINGRFTVLRPEYFSPEIAGLRPKDDTCYFHVIPDKSY